MIPVQASDAEDKLGVVQFEQTIALFKGKFPELKAYPIGSQFMEDYLNVLFLFELDGGGNVVTSAEKHYELVIR